MSEPRARWRAGRLAYAELDRRTQGQEDALDVHLVEPGMFAQGAPGVGHRAARWPWVAARVSTTQRSITLRGTARLRRSRAMSSMPPSTSSAATSVAPQVLQGIPLRLGREARNAEWIERQLEFARGAVVDDRLEEQVQDAEALGGWCLEARSGEPGFEQDSIPGSEHR
jgi:hypothetical protein